MSDAVEGIDAEGVTAWFEDHVELDGPLTFELITGGRSNLTYVVSDAAGRRWVLRRPPLGQVLESAHDMGREHRIQAALADTDVPVPPLVGLCTDPDVNGAPFYVMHFVDGTVVRDLPTAEQLTVAQRRRAGESIIDVLGRIHAVDVDAVGLGDLGRKEAYIERQLKRWHGQLEKSRTRELPVMDEVHDALGRSVPTQHGATIVHGDYRLDNCMLAEDGSLAAVLDWEICTLGDPLADVGLLCVYWTDRDDEQPTGITSATAIEGFPTKAELLDRYARATGRDLGEIDYYVAFGYWKLACILEGVYARYAGGSMGKGGQAGAELFGQMVEQLAVQAHDAVSRL